MQWQDDEACALRLKSMGKPCVHVGMTGLDPDVRFDKHKVGIQSNRYVLQYGLRLLPDHYEGFNPMSYDEARDKEVEVGIDLLDSGFGRRKKYRLPPCLITLRSVSRVVALLTLTQFVIDCYATLLCRSLKFVLFSNSR